MIITPVFGDITKTKADAIVNAANTSLLGGGGVDGAIHRAGGPEILEACRRIVARQGGCRTGDAVITPAGRLPATYVIHTVGPVWRGGAQGEAALLASCYSCSLELAVQHQCSSIAFPGISTGIYGYPKAEAARVAVEAIRLFTHPGSTLQQVLLVCFDQEYFDHIQSLMPEQGNTFAP